MTSVPDTPAYATTARPETLVRVGSIEGPAYAQHGPHAGDLAHVVRLGMCNLSCDYCPTPELVAGLGGILDTTAPLTTVAALAARIDAQWSLDTQAPVLLAGGEPLLQDHAILDLTTRATEARITWHAETNGTLPPPDWWEDVITHTVVRPRVGTRDAQHKRLNDRALLPWVELYTIDHAAFAFTVRTSSDVRHVATVCTWLGLSPATVWLHPVADSLAAQYAGLRDCHDTAAEHGFRLTPLVPPMPEHDPANIAGVLG